MEFENPFGAFGGSPPSLFLQRDQRAIEEDMRHESEAADII